MKTGSSLFRLILILSIALALAGTLQAQKGGGKGTSTGKPASAPTPSPTTDQPSSLQPLFISGKVLVDGGGTPPEPVVIERVCNGVARRQGYTDGKGAFQFQLDQNVGFQDASENSNLFGSDGQMTSNQNSDALRTKYQGCEIRAVLAGFLSSAVSLRLQGSTWQYDLGTIFLKRMDNVSGTTISMTTLNAPGDAKHAYEKGRKAFEQQKLADAEKELMKAVKIYPGLAAAWSLLGDIHQEQKQLDDAIKDYQQALTADPHFVNPCFGLALVAVQQKRWQDAMQFTDQVLHMNPAAYPVAYFYNAVAAFNSGKLEVAQESGKKFKTLDTDHRHPDVYLLLGQVYIRSGDYSSAAQEMRDYLTIAPNADNAAEVRATLKRLEDASVAKQQ